MSRPTGPLAALAAVTLFPSLAGAQSFGDVLGSTVYSEGLAGFVGPLDPGDGFGAALAVIGDLDGDGRRELAVGAPGTDGGGVDRGAVWILFLDAADQVRAAHRIDDAEPALAGTLVDGDAFGRALAPLADLDGDGVDELVVGVPGAPGAAVPGTVRVLFLEASGAVSSQVTIGQAQGGFQVTLTAADRFGTSLANVGDLDGNGVEDIAIGRAADNTWFTCRMLASGNVKGAWRIGLGLGGWGGGSVQPYVGTAIATLPDSNGDGLPEVVVAAVDPDLSDTSFAATTLYWSALNANGTAQSPFDLHSNEPLFDGRAPVASFLGAALASPGDFDGDGDADVFAGAPGDDPVLAGGSAVDAGGLWLLLGSAGVTARKALQVDVSATQVVAGDGFGSAVAAASALTSAGDAVVWVGAPGSDLGGQDGGAVFRLVLRGNDFPALVALRNGTGVNDVCLLETLPPAIGDDWVAGVDASAFPNRTSGFVLTDRRLDPGVFLGTEELLVDPVAGQLLFGLTSSSTNPWFVPIAIPEDPALLGLALGAQGFVVGGGAPFRLCNALDLTIGF